MKVLLLPLYAYTYSTLPPNSEGDATLSPASSPADGEEWFIPCLLQLYPGEFVVDHSFAKRTWNTSDWPEVNLRRTHFLLRSPILNIWIVIL